MTGIDRDRGGEMPGKRMAVALVAGAAALTAACSASPAPAPPAPSTSTVDPVNLSAFVNAPCGLPGKDELARFSLPAAGQAGPAQGIVECAWTPIYPKAPRYAAGVDMHSGGLAGLGLKQPSFAPVTVHGHPASHAGAGPTPGQCTVDAGVAPDTVLVVTATIPDPNALSDNPCTDADQFAAAIVGFQGSRAP